MKIQITKNGTDVSEGSTQLQKLQEEFKKNLHIKLSNLIVSDLLKDIQERINKADFITLDHKDAGKDLVMKDPEMNQILHEIVNDEKFLKAIEQITGLKKIRYFSGRVYKMIPGEDHYDMWHSDVVWHRVLTISINLSSDIYSGGVLLIRDKKTKKIIQEIKNTVPGDAIIFSISTDYQHMLTKVEGNIPKIALAGWLSSHIDLKSFDNNQTLLVNNKKSKIKSGSIIMLEKGLMEEYIENKLFIFNPVEETGFGLENLGTRLWEIVKKPIMFSEIKKIVTSEYDIGEEIFEKDLISLFNEMEVNKLLTIKN
ncbi:MAG: PqqD family protein [Candidatus Melainabacteria bacterium]|nr:PqqD family protein [Candidatus Melainabacteria bacterium]